MNYIVKSTVSELFKNLLYSQVKAGARNKIWGHKYFEIHEIIEQEMVKTNLEVLDWKKNLK